MKCIPYLFAVVPDHGFGLLGVHAIVGAVISHPDVALVGGISRIASQMQDGMPALDGHHRLEVLHVSLQESRDCLDEGRSHQEAQHAPHLDRGFYMRVTMVEYRKKHRQNSYPIIHCPMSEGVSEVSERANE